MKQIIMILLMLYPAINFAAEAVPNAKIAASQSKIRKINADKFAYNTCVKELDKKIINAIEEGNFSVFNSAYSQEVYFLLKKHYETLGYHVKMRNVIFEHPYIYVEWN